MALNQRWIKLGRLFMVAFLAFYVLPIWVILTNPFRLADKVIALAMLGATGLIWVWFWTRIVAGPDERFKLVALVLGAVLMALFTLMTPPQYGSFDIYVVAMVCATFRWRAATPLIVVVALASGALDVVRGTSGLQATGDIINDALVGVAGIAGRLLIEANQQLSLAREQIARLAVGEERLRFARDLHDLLGHSLSVIALKSELAGRLIKRSPGLAEHEVADIEKVARDALHDVREAVSGYRQPTLAAELAGAREALTAAGIDCRIQQDHATLPPAVESVFAWAVREGTTNAMKHSKATRCVIRVVQGDRSATVEVIDNGTGGAPKPGSGLRGLEERVRERGGTLTAEPLLHEGFRLRVTLPVTPIAESPHPGVVQPPTPTLPRKGGGGLD
ncbi:MAG TPA: sensor histidine kinase [Candidatus Dormibacteraeota bacterium]|nr:sensor histidine kinase [Candidatus Dormibacteraeota bacterium]